MIGLQYHRRKQQMTVARLSELSGVTKECIRKYEKEGMGEGASTITLLALADALKISIEDLLHEYDGEELTTVDRATRTSSIHSPGNVIHNYRIAHNLRYQELADLLGLAARESARVVCQRATARQKHVLRLCQHENISQGEFLERYSCCA